MVRDGWLLAISCKIVRLELQTASSKVPGNIKSANASSLQVTFSWGINCMQSQIAVWCTAFLCKTYHITVIRGAVRSIDSQYDCRGKWSMRCLQLFHSRAHFKCTFQPIDVHRLRTEFASSTITIAIKSLVVSEALTTCCAIPNGLNSWKGKSNANNGLINSHTQATMGFCLVLLYVTTIMCNNFSV